MVVKLSSAYQWGRSWAISKQKIELLQSVKIWVLRNPSVKYWSKLVKILKLDCVTVRQDEEPNECTCLHEMYTHYLPSSCYGQHIIPHHSANPHTEWEPKQHLWWVTYIVGRDRRCRHGSRSRNCNARARLPPGFPVFSCGCVARRRRKWGRLKISVLQFEKEIDRLNGFRPELNRNYIV